ncbi:hypothetical protein G7046_g7038 [Stylonectria norvegica]|nr:hypothetical protein G7046_g7038 [Stylonectria norvegica]
MMHSNYGDDGDEVYTSTTLITIHRTTTICPTPSPPPPPCPDGPRKLVARGQPSPGDGAVNPGFVNARIMFVDRYKTLRPVRYQKVTAYATVYDEDGNFVQSRTSWATTSGNGCGTWQFSIRDGQSVIVRTLVTEVKGKNYRVGTRLLETDSFTTANVRQNLLSFDYWFVDAGETISLTSTYSYAVGNRALWVGEGLRTVSDYARNEVLIENELKPIDVWFPSVLTQKDADGNVVLKTAYLSQHGDARPRVWPLHPLPLHRRRRAQLPGPGGAHGICNETDYDVGLTFSEGFATAFGLMAIDQTPLAEGYMIFKQTTSPEELKLSTGLDFERYSCQFPKMLHEEGRIGAAMLEMVDRKLDVFPKKSDNAGRISSTFKASNLDIRFDPRFIFWENMQAVPVSFDGYWYNMRKHLTKSDEAKVWALLDYHYVDFPRVK